MVKQLELSVCLMRTSDTVIWKLRLFHIHQHRHNYLCDLKMHTKFKSVLEKIS